MHTRRIVAGTALALLLVGCSKNSVHVPSPSPSAPPSPSRSPSPSSSDVLGGGDGEQASAPRSTIITTPSVKLSTASAAKEIDGTCPYISADDFHQYEGDRVGRVTLLQTNPVGCRFYFAYQPDAIVGEVLVQPVADTTTAINTMILSAKAHPEVQSSAIIGAGAVAYRTLLQGEQTWQCVFALGNRVYTVRTRQTDTAKDSFNLAAAVVRTVK